MVLDAGHGGVDEGAVSFQGLYKVAEKNITLVLAHQVANLLKKAGIDARLTRTGDRDVGLAERTALANKIKADLFLSIHMNSMPETGRKQAASGVETYILNGATDATSRRLAHMENSVVSTFDSGNSDVAVILKDLKLESNLGESKRLACLVQGELVSATHAPRGLTQVSIKPQGRPDRGVKQALFHVLLGADMPSVLVEAGFISNATDRARVLSSAGQKALSSAIATAIERFLRTRGSKLATTQLSTCLIHRQ